VFFFIILYKVYKSGMAKAKPPSVARDVPKFEDS